MSRSTASAAPAPSGRLARIEEPVSYALEDGVATVTMDDGKANVISTGMLEQLFAALDRAEQDGAVTVLTGREQTFSGGFDLRCPPERVAEMVGGGARLVERLLSFPQPVVAACNGNAVAMAAMILLSCDLRLGASGEFRIGLNEVAIGLTLPWFAIALARHRLAPPFADRCGVTGAMLDPEEAVAAGFLDRIVPGDRLHGAAADAAATLRNVDLAAHRATKLRLRAQVLEGVREGIERISSSDREW